MDAGAHLSRSKALEMMIIAVISLVVNIIVR